MPEWCERFDVLVLQSEEVYEHPRRALKQACDFLGVNYRPDYFTLRRGKKVANRNSGRYAGPMRPEMREKLEEYFEPYNQRLYVYLDRDFGW